ncbi:MAG: hypothetical protein SRB2_00356 [Desulfobacteraceae bacterium Eth-SRB2]|nr:MAG: hypothetical protein SRB2_00356 [Desulfobacteraceae bacterium Eth-SRB2]
MTQVTQLYYILRIEKHTCYTHVTTIICIYIKAGKVVSLVSPISYLIDIYVNIANLLCHFFKKLCHCCVTKFFGCAWTEPQAGIFQIGGDLK